MPLYLGGLAAAQGLDPTDSSGLQDVAREQADLPRRDRERLKTRGPPGGGKDSIWSSLYAAPVAVAVAPLCRDGWEQFKLRWRTLGYGALVLGALGVGAAGVGGRAAPLGAALGLALLSQAGFDLVENLRLAQANVLLAGLAGIAAFALSRGRSGAGGAVAAVAAVLKLGPGLLLAPLLVGRRWWGVGAGLAVAVAALLLTAPVMSPLTAIADTWDTVRASTDLPRPRGSWPAWQMWLLDHRGRHLAWATLLLPTALVGLVGRDDVARRDLLAATLPLVLAWMAGTGRLELGLYAVLLFPGSAFLLAGALPGPGWLWRVWAAPVGLIPLIWAQSGNYPHVMATLAAIALWSGLALRMLATAASAARRWQRSRAPEGRPTGIDAP